MCILVNVGLGIYNSDDSDASDASDYGDNDNDSKDNGVDSDQELKVSVIKF